MPAVDLNADLGEGATLTPSDAGVLDAVTSVSIACGFHAGSPSVMRATAAVCVERNIAIGAHVSYRDREGFGRREVDVDPAQLTSDLVEQCIALAHVVDSLGGRVAYLKPHGALYHRMLVDPVVAAVVTKAASDLAIGVLVTQLGGVLEAPAREAGLRLVGEGFPDRAYRSDGRLVSRDLEGSVVGDPREVGRRAVTLVAQGGVEAVTGEWTPVTAETLCVHGDAPDAARTARVVREALVASGVTVRSFVDPNEGPPRDGPGRWPTV